MGYPRLTVYLTPPIRKGLAMQAVIEGRNLSQVTESALRGYLKRHGAPVVKGLIGD